MTLKIPLEKRIRDNVDKSGGPDACWPWLKYKIKTGYGVMGVFKNGKTRTKLAHRVAYAVHHGVNEEDIPECVLHTCDNPPCCNPKHLFLGTHQDNMDDRDAKGRQARLKGEDNPRAKTTEEQVREVRRLNRELGWGAKRIAEHMGMGRSRTQMIVKGHTWRHVSDGS